MGSRSAGKKQIHCCELRVAGSTVRTDHGRSQARSGCPRAVDDEVK